MMELTEQGKVRRERLERVRQDLGSGRLIEDDDFVLMEIGREQPVSMDRFLIHMEELGFGDRQYVRDLVTDWHFAGYVT